jgi:hypothetical protein
VARGWRRGAGGGVVKGSHERAIRRGEGAFEPMDFEQFTTFWQPFAQVIGDAITDQGNWFFHA